MKLESRFRIPVERQQVFDNFLDADIMRQALPGCSSLDKSGDTHFSGHLSNTIAHVRFEAAFSADVTTLTRPSEIKATLSGEDQRLASTLRLDAAVRFEDDADGTVVSYAIEMAMWGKLGRMGEAIFRRRTVEVEKQFVDAFTRLCQGDLALVASASVPGRVARGSAARPTASRVRSVAARAAPFITRGPADVVGAASASPVPGRNGGAPVPAAVRSKRRLSLRDRVELVVGGLLVAAAAGFAFGRRSRCAPPGGGR